LILFNKIKYLLFALLILLAVNLFSQQDDYITVVGDKLIGKTIDGQFVREIIGNVILTQGDVIINCDKAIQYLIRNDAELIGNVVVKQDSITILADKGFYYGDTRKAVCTTGVTLDDRKVILTANIGEYYFNEDIAFFRDDVKLYDTVSTLTSDFLTYYQKENKAIAVSRVNIVDDGGIIQADSLIHFRDEKNTFAFNNVALINHNNNVTIYGHHLEDYAVKHLTIIEQEPLLLQIDTTDDGTLDTLIITALRLESYRDTAEIFIAIDSVQLYRGTFSSKNDYTQFLRNEEKIITNKIYDAVPIMWIDNSQLSGDSITIYLEDDNIKKLEVDKNGFLLSQHVFYTFRYDQISGEKLVMHFDENNLIRTEVFENVLSIYYMYEEDEPNGLTQSSSQSSVILFEDNRVVEVKLYGAPASEYHPENLVEGNELSFTLPSFIIYEGRPVKEKLLQIDNKRFKNQNSEIEQGEMIISESTE
jgi:lipopolysaccharide export system protein LptA